MTSAVDPIELRLAADVRFRRLADEAVIVRQDAGEVLVLNELGARILEIIETRSAASEARRAGASSVEVVAQLNEEYEDEDDRLNTEVNAFLHDLITAGVLEEVALR